jgi:hypothetical protein
MNNTLIVTVLALGLAAAQNSIAGKESNRGMVEYDYTGSVVETHAMTTQGADAETIPHQEGYDGLEINKQRSGRQADVAATGNRESYDGLPIQEPVTDVFRPGKSASWSYLY